MLGIVIGVAAVIALVSIGRGAQASVTSQIEANGTNLIYVRPGSTQQSGVASATGSAGTLTQDDAEALRGVAGVAAVAPELEGRGQVSYLGSNVNTRAIGVTPEYMQVRNMTLADGEFISESNVNARSSVVVLGSGVAEDLFGGTAGAVGQKVRINSQPYTVIGVLESKGSTGLGSVDDQVLVPISTAQARLLGGGRYRGANVLSSINVQAENSDVIDSTIEQITLVLRERHDTYEGADDFTVSNQQDLL
ncbi:MAG TPA: ABC transporter permease, partial [Anaerolineales bacterium]|nr:ABC transporter permease [Anaerolineales bacterium]